MAVDIYDSQYLLILAPSLVIALMFLFFWLFMKETSYDEVLAKQKRDLKLPPSKPDPRKKNEKKKSKKKESSSGGSGGGTGGGGESEEDLRDFDVAEGANSSTVEVEEEPVSAATPDPALPTPTPYVPVSVSPEAPAGLRERKKKEKKAAKAAAAAAAAAAATTVSPSEEPEVNGSKPVSCKTEAPLAASKQSSTPSPKREVQVQIQAVQAPVQAQTPPQISGKKKEKKKQKVESDEQHTEVKVEQAPATVKKEAPIVAETKVLDGATQSVTSGKKKNSAKKQKTDHVDEAHILPDSAASANHQAAHNDDAPSKGSGKKQKNETDKENTEVKLKELLSGLSSLALSDAEAVSVMALLREKSPNAVDAWHKSSTRPDPTAQEREKLLTTLQEEASIAKDKVKQLSQELQVEKQKTNRVESMMREQRAAMEKELGSMQGKAQGTYQELQTMQIKFQQVREQLEGQISRLQQENSILRDAVSSATNQMESKNSAELNKLRSEYAGLMKELSDSNSKLQQEEHQRKSLEVSYKQNVSQLEAQLQDAKRRWEELQNFIHSVNAEREKIQTSKQELHNQLLAVEAEMSNKNKEIQTLHSSLTEAVVSKDRLEQKVRELMEMSKHSMQDDSLQARVQELMNENKSLQVQISTQATHVSHIEELQKLLAEKELQRKSLEDSLNAERSSGASRETNMQALHNENMSLKAEIQNLQAQISDQTASQLALDQFQKSVREKEENMKTVEGLLEKGLIEVANKEEELKTTRKENESLKQEIEDLKKKMDKQVSSELMVEELQSKIQEKETKLKMVEESLQAAQDSSSAREKTVEALEQQLAALQAEMEQLRQKETAEALTSSATQLQELQAQLVGKDQKIQTLQSELEARTKELSEKIQQQSHTVVPSPELLTALSEKEKQVSILQAELAELRNTVNLQRKKNDELREKNWSAMEALSATESMLQGKLSKAVKENQTALAVCQAECRDVLHRLLPHVPLPSEQNHQEWLQRFERAAGENSAPQSSPGSGDSEELAEKLKEAEETQRVLQKDCETYKKVLAETEGILQRLQNSVEQEESRWRVKLELSQAELREMSQKVAALEQEVERLTDEAELENLRREKQHLESELERAERESATYVTEVRELKTQLTETLSKLEAEENERQKVAGDLYKAQQSVDLIQGELSKVTDNADDLIENSSLSSQREEIDRNEKMTAGLGQTVTELQQLLQTVSRQLTKRQEGEADKDLPKV
ncbi:kinectin isoform X4 [Simochromis diagramma]|uniref:kinectin isoform X4 n=1 Tax=Simochromis diagramma TaxID=43689 RepID=UPI001A7E4DE9|nr:kinectin isoform X4 [Simochromis diagramma]